MKEDLWISKNNVCVQHKSHSTGHLEPQRLDHCLKHHDPCQTGCFKSDDDPGGVDQLVRALFLYAKIAGSIPGQGTYENQTINA